MFIGLGISACLLALFVDISTNTFVEKNMDVFDYTITNLVRYLATPNLDRLMIYITTIGSAHFYGTLAPLILCRLAFSHRWREASAFSICLIGAGALNYLLKYLFERSRPDVLQLVLASGYSFPSGHAMVSLCFYGMLTYLISRNIPHWHWRFILFIFTTILVIAIGISRIYLGVHYPSDILGGYTAGATWLSFCISLLLWWEKRKI